jgi:hypothetical protein
MYLTIILSRLRIEKYVSEDGVYLYTLTKKSSEAINLEQPEIRCCAISSGLNIYATSFNLHEDEALNSLSILSGKL